MAGTARFTDRILLKFKTLYLKDGFEGGCKAAQNVRKRALDFLITEDLYDPEATVLIYVYANLKAIKGSFDVSNALEKISKVNQFQSGFQVGIANSQAILADLDVSEQSRMACLKSELSIAESLLHILTAYKP